MLDETATLDADIAEAEAEFERVGILLSAREALKALRKKHSLSNDPYRPGTIDKAKRRC